MQMLCGKGSAGYTNMNNSKGQILSSSRTLTIDVRSLCGNIICNNLPL